MTSERLNGQRELFCFRPRVVANGAELGTKLRDATTAQNGSIAFTLPRPFLPDVTSRETSRGAIAS